MRRLRPIAESYGVKLVEDCAQAIGATTGLALAGTHGDIGALSFYPTKNLGALGDAGAIVTANAQLASQVRSLRRYGESEDGTCIRDGINSRLDEIQAAILRVRLSHLAESNERRNAIARHYDAALASTDVVPLARLPGHRHVYCLYVVRAPQRDAFIRELERRGIATEIHYPIPIHGHPVYRSLAEGTVGLETSERLAREVVSLPLYPDLTDAEVEHVADSARRAAAVH
jgi:dTDP-4-amino-4,6-dideoxygalactose transaminase